MSDEIVLQADEALEANQYVELGPNYAKFKEDTPYEVWAHVVSRLQGAEKSLRWWIGDALRFGERKYGEMYAQALEETTYTYGTLRNSVYVADKYSELSFRNDNCSFRQHEIAAALEPDERSEVLEMAAEKGWSHKELREEVRERRMLPAGAKVSKTPEEDSDVEEGEEKAQSMMICPLCHGDGIVASGTKVKKVRG